MQVRAIRVPAQEAQVHIRVPAPVTTRTVPAWTGKVTQGKDHLHEVANTSHIDREVVAVAGAKSLQKKRPGGTTARAFLLSQLVQCASTKQQKGAIDIC